MGSKNRLDDASGLRVGSDWKFDALCFLYYDWVLLGTASPRIDFVLVLLHSTSVPSPVPALLVIDRAEVNRDGHAQTHLILVRVLM